MGSIGASPCPYGVVTALCLMSNTAEWVFCIKFIKAGVTCFAYDTAYVDAFYTIFGSETPFMKEFFYNGKGGRDSADYFLSSWLVLL